MQNICNICGANYEYVNGKWMCPACGAYKAEEISNEEATLLYNAAQKLRLADFDEAEQAYSDIVEKYPFNSEGYWGRLLSKYGIKYEEDFDGKKIPTCYATTIESVMGDSNYQRALELATPDVREYYTRQAEYIERVRKEWVDKASHEAPYDVFICYKDSDLANGVERTQDSVAAQELYIHLIEQGYRVFFSRESLRDKVGEKYEPYIFNALSTAKVMLVYGTNPEYITSTWLKNEWTRYQKRIQAGEKKEGSLVTICDGFSPNELPRTLAANQCFDATKRSFYGDLDKYVKKYTKEDEPVVVPPISEGTTAAEATVVAPKKNRKPLILGIGAALIAVILAIVLLPGLFTSDFEYKDAGNGTVTITKYSSDDTVIEIPATIGGKPVTSIDARAFDSMDNVTSITIPDSITSIGANAFYGCTSVKSITIPASVKTVGTSAFYGWTKNQTIVLAGYAEMPTDWNSQWNASCEARITFGRLIVTYDSNGGAGKMDNQAVDSNSSFTALKNKFTREGYTFAGWSTASSGKALYQDGGKVTSTDKAMTLYAIWAAKANQIVYHANGGEGSMSSQSANSDARVTLSTNRFTKEGYEFSGWSTTSGGSVSYRDGETIKYGTASKMNLYAVWEPTINILTYSPNGGTGSMDQVQALTGDPVKLDPNKFTRTGYTFAGWSETPDGSVQYPNNTEYVMGTGNVTLYAVWAPRSYKLSFDGHGGTASTASMTVAFNSTVTLPTDVRRTGYTFMGWALSENGEVAYQPGASYTHTKAGTMTFYAVWLGNEYTLTFDANGGTGSMNSLTVRAGDKTKLPACTFTKEGYMLKGWSTTKGGTTVSYLPEGDYTMGTSNRTLYAVWTETEYPITYVMGNHAVNHDGNPDFYLTSSATITLGAPTREGYEFVGWFSDEAMTVACNTIEKGSLGAKTFYAKWKALPETLIFDANGGTGTMTSITSSTDAIMNLPQCLFTREHYVFAGWSLSPSGKAQYKAGEAFTVPSHGVTFYAVWTPVSYTISYDLAGGTHTGAVKEYNIESVAFTLGTPTRAGYEFIGWSGTDINGVQKTVYIAKGSVGNRTYTANWKAIQHTITFVAGFENTTGLMESMQASTGETVTLPKSTMQTLGYVFKGWSTVSTGQTKVDYADGATFTMGTESLTLYAVWELKNTGLQFTSDGKSGYVVSGYAGTDTVIEIPTSYIDGYVTAIGAGAFQNNTTITTVNLTNKITSIGENAFNGCTNLATITYNGTAFEIAKSAFVGTAYYNNSANWIGDVFYFEKHLIGPKNQSISGDYVIPSGTKMIVANAFAGCSSLSTVFIPGSVQQIGANAFKDCSALTIRCEVSSKPSGWQTNWNVSGCPVDWDYKEQYTDTATGLQYELYPDGTAIVIGYTGTATELKIALDGYVIKSIAQNVFKNNTTLKKVELSEGLVEIGNYAFRGCTALISINLPSTLTTVGSYAFYNCDALQSIVIPAGATVKNQAFGSCDSLIIYAGVAQQGAEWDSTWNSSDRKVYWNVKTITTDAQGVTYAIRNDNTVIVTAYNGTATEVTLALDGYTITEIGGSVFGECKTLTKIVIPDTVAAIGTHAFYNCTALTNVKLPASLKTIGDYAFYNCDALTEITIPEGVTAIGIYTFNGCDKLMPVTLPTTLESIGERAFAGCISMHEILIPQKTTTIGYFAFYNCSNLTIYCGAATQPDAWDSNWNPNSRKVYWDIQGVTTDTQGVVYAIRNDKTAIVVHYHGTATEITLSLDGYTVTDVGSSAFNGFTTLTKIVLPNTVKVIGDSAFRNCDALVSMSLPSSLTTIGSYAFYDCDALTELVIPEGVVEIGTNAFSQCSSVRNVQLPSTLTTIGDYAFYNIGVVKVIYIPASVTEMGYYVFNSSTTTFYCGAASQPDTWQGGWSSHNRPVVWGVAGAITDAQGVVYTLDDKGNATAVSYVGASDVVELTIALEGRTVIAIADNAFKNLEDLKVVNLPNGLLTIGYRAFYNCRALKSITLPASVTAIGEESFAQCGSLATVTLSESLTAIGASAFANCSNLTGIVIPAGVTKLENSTFYCCSKMTSVTLPNGMTEIGSHAFYSCSKLESINFPTSLQVIGDNAFNDCDRLVNIVLPEGLTEIQASAFYNCENLETVTLPSTLTTIGDSAFGYCYKLTEITIPGSVKVIGNNAFRSCGAMVRIILNEGVESIGSSAFYGCNSLKTLTLPSSLTTIGEYAFYNSGLNTVILPAGVTSIGARAFAECYSLTLIFIPASVAEIDEYAFNGCSNITVYAAAASEPNKWDSYWHRTGNNYHTVVWGVSGIVTDAQGVVYLTNADKTAKVIGYSGIAESITIALEGYTVTEIGKKAFYNCDTLKSVVIGEGVVTIGEYAFYACSSLAGVSFPSSLTTIEQYAFDSCNALRTVFIPSTVTTMGYYVFGNYSYTMNVYAQAAAKPDGWDSSWIYNGNTTFGVYGIYVDNQGIIYRLFEDNTASVIGWNGTAKDITIPASVDGYAVKTIAANAFSNRDITSVIISEGITTIGEYAFAYCNSLTSVTIPASITTMGTRAFNDCDALTTLNLTEGLKVLGDHAFYDCNALTSVTIPASLTIIENHAFYACQNLVNVTLTEGLTVLGDSMFQYCQSLTRITIPASVTTIGNHPFWESHNVIILTAHTSKPESWSGDWNWTGNTYCPVAWGANDLYVDEAQGLIYALYSNGTAILLQYKGSAASVTVGVEGYTVIGIGERAFYDCDTLTAITLSSGLLEIGAQTFYDCDGLTEITIPASVTKIGTEAFYSCGKLTTVNLSVGLLEIGDSVFYNCTKLANITLPETLTTIGPHAFRNCDALTTVYIPASVATIGYFAFYDCSSSLTIFTAATQQPSGWDSQWNPNGRTVIWGATSLYTDETTGITYALGSDNTAYVYAYNGTATELVIPDLINGYTVTKIGSNVFYNNDTLTSVQLPSGLLEIGSQAFYDCDNIAGIALPNGLLKIGNQAFYSCGQLAAITFPNTLNSIGESAFHGCSALETIHIPVSVTTIGYAAFCNASVTITAEATSKSEGWHDEWNINGFTVTWNYAGTVTDEQGVTYILHPNGTASVYSYNGTATELTFAVEGYTVASIYPSVFQNNSTLTKVTIPEGIIEIGSASFRNCDALTDISLPSSLRKIGFEAFYDCDALVSIVIPEGVTEIDSNVFYSCNKLQSVTLPSTLTTIGGHVFYNNDQLKILYIPASVVNVGNYMIYDCDYVTIYCGGMSDLPDTWDSGWNPYDRPVVWGVAGVKTDTQGVVYALNGDGTASAVGFIGDSEITVITLALEGYTVTSIGNNAFSNLEDLKAVHLSNGLLTIGERAFYNCRALKSITLPASVTAIGSSAFAQCGSLATVTLSESLTAIGEHAFSDCVDLTSIDIPAGVTKIEASTFYGCSKLNTVTLRGVTEIGSQAFYGCYKLESISFPNTLTVIGDNAFNDCDRLVNIVLPEGLTEIKASAFYYCDNLETVTLPSTLTAIGASAFSNCYKLTEITIPGSVKTISESAFYHCNGLIRVTIGEGVQSIGNHAFTYCYALQTVILPSTLQTIGDSAFEQAHSIRSLIIPSGVTAIGKHAFDGCSGMSFIYIPASVEDIDEYAFQSCSNITIYAEAASEPDMWDAYWNYNDACPVVWGVAGIVTDAQGVVYQTNTDMTAKVIGFAGTAESITIALEGYTVTEIGKKAFYDCDTLKSVVIGEGVVTIGEYAFYACSSLAGVSFPSSLTTIGQYAFDSCNELRTVFIPSGVTTMGYHAFANYSYSENVYAQAAAKPDGWDSSWLYSGNVTFGVYGIYVDNQGIIYRLYEDNTAAVVGWNGITKDITIQASVNGYVVKSIEAYAFNGRDLTSVVISEGITTIGDHAFYDCNSLTSVTIPASITAMGSQAFFSCGALTTLNLTEGLQVLGEYAFQNCYSLKSVTIPASLTTIGINAFLDCDALVNVTLTEGLTVIGQYMFQGCDSLARLYIPASVLTIEGQPFSVSYKVVIWTAHTSKPEGWSSDWNWNGSTDCPVAWGASEIYVDEAQGLTYALYSNGTAVLLKYTGSAATVTIGVEGYTVVEIGAYAFYDCDTLTEITIPASVTKLGSHAFYICGNLTTVNLSEGLLEISDHAFQTCTKLANITFPETLTTIGQHAFDNCDSLTEVYIPASVTTIGYWAFGDCSSNLSFFTAATQKPSGWDSSWNPNGRTVIWGARTLYTDETTGITYALNADNTAYVYAYNGTATELVIPDTVNGYTVTKIGSNVFYNNDTLTSVKLPSGLLEIGSQAFYDCDNIAGIALPNGLLKIGYQAFYSCDKLAAITFPNTLTEIGESAFYNCSILETIHIPASVTTIGNYAFRHTSVTITAEAASKPEGWNNSWNTNGYTVTWHYAGMVTDEQGVTYILHPNGTASVYSYNGTATELTFAVEGYTVVAIYPNVFKTQTTLTKVTLPDTLTSIGSQAFYGCTALASINLPSGLTTIGYEAFYNCDALTSVTLPGSLTSIGHSVFYDCDGLTSVVISNGIAEIGSDIFHDCNKLQTVTLPDNMTVIGSNMFYWCTALETINLPSGLTTIGSNAFYNCDSLKKLDLPSSVTYIGEWAFADCGALADIVIPASVTYVGSHAFYQCYNLTIYVCAATQPNEWVSDWNPNGRPVVWNFKAFYTDTTYGVTYLLFNDNTATAYAFDGSVKEVVVALEGYTVTELGDNLFKNRTALTSVTLTEGLLEIGSYVFYDCQRLTTLSIPAGVQKIGDYAFSGCRQITEFSFGDGLTTIGVYAFQNCSQLKKVVLPDSVTSIGDGAFNGCTALEEVTLPAGLGTVPSSLFNGCETLKKVTLNEGITEIGSSAFQNCTSLTTVTLPSTLQSIGSHAFEGCTSLTEISISGNVKTIGSQAFYNCTALATLTIGNGVQTIGEYAFNNCDVLTRVELPDSVTTLGYAAFNDCNSLTYVKLSNAITTIAQSVFQSCDKLETVLLPAGLTEIGYNAFYYCKAMESIIIPEGVVTVGNYAFSGCTKLTICAQAYMQPSGWSSSWNSSNCPVVWDFKELVTDEQGVTYAIRNDGTVVVLHYNGTATELTLGLEGNTLTDIPTIAFRGNTTITKIVIPEGVTSISNYAFSGCTALESVTFPSTLKTIGVEAFNQCSALKELTLPSSLTTIENNAFVGCYSLTNIMLPSGLTTIGQYAFDSCNALRAVFIPSSVTSIGYHAFCNYSYSINIYVQADARPDGWSSSWYYSATVAWGADGIYVDEQGVVYQLYQDTQTAAVSSYVGTATELTLLSKVQDYTVTEIAANAFKSNSRIINVIIPEGIVSIGEYAFDSCTNLAGVTLPSTLTTIGQYAFRYCYALRTVYIPAAVTTIGYRALYNQVYNMTVCVQAETKPDGWDSSWYYNATVVWGVYGAYTDEQGAFYRLYEDGTAGVIGWNGTTKDITIPATVNGYKVKTIEANAFNSRNITSIIISEGITTIGEHAFQFCNSLTNVTIPASITTMGISAFADCDALTTLNLTEGLTVIGDQAFHECSALANLTIPASITTMGARAFSSCGALVTLNLTDGLTVIGNYSFYGCGSLESVTIPASITTMGAYAFGYCNALKTVTLKEGLTFIGQSAFDDCNALTTVTIPSSVKTIELYAFCNCTSLTTVYISAGVTTIQSGAFHNCSSELTFYIAESEQPSGWSGDWCTAYKEIVWNYDPEE